MAKSNLELKISGDLKEVIREIIREELAAHEERLKCDIKNNQSGKIPIPV